MALTLETAEQLPGNSDIIFGFATGLLSDLREQGSRVFLSHVVTSRHFRMFSKVAKTSTMNLKDLILFSTTKSGGGYKNTIGFIAFTPL